MGHGGADKGGKGWEEKHTRQKRSCADVIGGKGADTDGGVLF